MKKFILMAAVAVFAVSAAFASFRQPTGIVRVQQHAVIDTLPTDTTQLPPKTDTTPADTSTTDTSSVSH